MKTFFTIEHGPDRAWRLVDPCMKAGVEDYKRMHPILVKQAGEAQEKADKLNNELQEEIRLHREALKRQQIAELALRHLRAVKNHWATILFPRWFREYLKVL